MSDRASRLAEVIRVSLRLCEPSERTRVFRELARSYCFACGNATGGENCTCDASSPALPANDVRA